ncbi:MAG TPA: NRDE family protein [Burkholderiales bacterium]|nr:NRDE family protein [Burkholderiales bacterium]
MCLILFAHRVHPAYPLVVAANRDEWFRRPTAPAAFWPDAPEVFAGRDLEQQGTWLGITRTGRFAALTNYRDPGSNRADAPSRGALVSAFLRSETPPPEYLERLRDDAARYNGFSLLVGDGVALSYFSNRDGDIRSLSSGLYGLSNSLLDVDWPKVQSGKARLAAALDGTLSAQALLELLDDTGLASDRELPSTGVTLEWERRLSSLRIVADGYGTRSSTALLVGADGEVTFVERSFDDTGGETGIVRQRFSLER